MYFQYYDGIMPCPLCILQRITFFCLGLFFLVGILLHRQRVARILTNLFAFLASTVGIALAGRQVWIQQFQAGDTSECGVSLEYMWRVLPLNELMQKIFAGSAECTQRGWVFLSLNMAEWALVCFVGFLLLTGYLLLKDFKRL